MTTTTQSSEKDEPVVLPVSLRDYFAAAAMQAIIAGKIPLTLDHSWTECDLWAPALAYRVADAMLKERAK